MAALFTGRNGRHFDQSVKMRKILCRPSRSSKRNKITDRLSCALAEVAKVPEHIHKVATCLRTVVDPFPNEMSHVSELVHSTLFSISDNTW